MNRKENIIIPKPVKYSQSEGYFQITPKTVACLSEKSLEMQKGIPNIQTLKIRFLGTTETAPMDLLLNADPSEKLVRNYLSKGICLIAEIQDKIVGALILMPTGIEKMEIMNVSVSEKMQNLGIIRKLFICS